MVELVEVDAAIRLPGVGVVDRLSRCIGGPRNVRVSLHLHTHTIVLNIGLGS